MRARHPSLRALLALSLALPGTLAADAGEPDWQHPFQRALRDAQTRVRTPAFERDDAFRAGERPTFEATVDTERLRTLMDANEVTLLDVRLEEDFAAAPEMIPGALRADPEYMDAWLIGVPRTRPVVVYCVAGRWVSQKAATLLEREGLEVYSLEGGLQAWQTAHDD